jgi:hypothetical protein
LPFVKISTRIDLLTLSAYLRSHASPIAPNNQGGRHRRDTRQTPSNGPHPRLRSSKSSHRVAIILAPYCQM